MRSNPEDGHGHAERMAFARDFQARMERETAAKRAHAPNCAQCGSDGGKAGIGAKLGLCWPCEKKARAALDTA